MAGASLLALLDDITSILDDIALMTKTAAVKTTGVVGDDLAVNVEQVSGVVADRELSVVWAVAKGSLRNKAILVPAALALSAFAPWLIMPLLMVGGTYLCYEGAEKIFQRFLPGAHGEAPAPQPVRTDPASAAGPEEDATEPKNAAGAAAQALQDAQNRSAQEKKKIQGAVRTDFVLSTEIIIVALGTIPATAPFSERAFVLVLIGLLMTVGVYGVVGGIVKLDDAGLYIARAFPGGAAHVFGLGLVRFVPLLMRFLTVAGTVAMFMVGGGILAHGLHFFHYVSDALAGLPLEGVLDVLAHAAFGLVIGSAALLIHIGATRLYRCVKSRAS